MGTLYPMLAGKSRSWGSQPAVESGLLPSGWVFHSTEFRSSGELNSAGKASLWFWALSPRLHNCGNPLPTSPSLVLILTKLFPAQSSRSLYLFSDAAEQISRDGWCKTIPPVSSHCWRGRVAGFSAWYLAGLKSSGWLAVFSAGTQDPVPSPFRWLIDFSPFLLQD